MAGILGEGGFVSLSGTCSAESPAVLMDFRRSYKPTSGPDGIPANLCTFVNGDTANTHVLHVKVQGLHDNSTANMATVLPLTAQTFQFGLKQNDIVYVEGWLSKLADGTADTASSMMVAGFVSGRR